MTNLKIKSQVIHVDATCCPLCHRKFTFQLINEYQCGNYEYEEEEFIKSCEPCGYRIYP